MAISMDRFSSEGHFAKYDPFFVEAPSASIFILQCHSCGNELEKSVTPPRLCPKCGSRAWERVVRPRSILENAARD